MARRAYAGGANKVALTAPILESTNVLPVDPLFGWPSGNPFVAVIGRGTATEEKVLCVSATAGIITVDPNGRGYDGTSKFDHGAGELVEHVISAIDMDEANQHVNATTGVHGLAGSDRVVGRTSVDTLTGKTMSGADNVFTDIDITSIPYQVLFNASTDSRLDQHDLDIAARYTKGEVDGLFDAEEGLRYTKTEVDDFFDVETGAREAGDTARYLKTETYSQTEVDDLLDEKLTVTDLDFQDYTPVIAGTTSGGSLGTGSIAGRWNEIGNRVFYEITLTLGTTSFGTGNLTLTLPAEAASLNWPLVGVAQMTDVSVPSSGGIRVGIAALDTVNRIVLAFDGGVVNGAAPFAWASGDVIRVQGSYEKAI